MPEPLHLSVGLGIALDFEDEGLAESWVRRVEPFVVAPGPNDIPKPDDIEVRVRPLADPVPAHDPLWLAHKDRGWQINRKPWRMEVKLGPPSRACLGLKPFFGELPLSDQAMQVSVALRALLWLVAPHHDVLFLHAAGAESERQTLALVGPPDAGKTTACKCAPVGTRVLSDEHVLARKGQGGWDVHATPYSSDGIRWGSSPGWVPLKALFLLERGPLSITQAAVGHAVRALMAQTAKLGSPTGAQALGLCADLAQSVPAYRLVTGDPSDVWPAILRTLEQEG